MSNYWIEKAEKEEMEISLYHYLVEEFNTEDFTFVNKAMITEAIETFITKNNIDYEVFWTKANDGSLILAIP